MTVASRQSAILKRARRLSANVKRETAKKTAHLAAFGALIEPSIHSSTNLRTK
jgi:hypothetical protein